MPLHIRRLCSLISGTRRGLSLNCEKQMRGSTFNFQTMVRQRTTDFNIPPHKKDALMNKVCVINVGVRYEFFYLPFAYSTVGCGL